eukprot:1142741-Pelagomonas_calceolata.AAC.2
MAYIRPLNNPYSWQEGGYMWVKNMNPTSEKIQKEKKLARNINMHRAPVFATDNEPWLGCLMG